MAQGADRSILVTGGAGFIGSHTVVALAAAGFRPVIIDDFSNSQQRVLDGLRDILGYDVPCYVQDCNDRAILPGLFQRENICGVIHFAAFKAVGESMEEPLRYYRNNLGSLMTLLEVMLETGVSDLIFSSSCTVYGEPETLPVAETAPVQPAASVYGNTKQICEEMLRDTAAAGKPLRCIALRYFNPVGAHPTAKIGELPLGTPNNLVPYITQTAAGIRPQMTIFGDDYPTPDGTCIRDFIHVMDLAEAHVAALRALQQLGADAHSHYDVLNAGTGRGHSVLELVRLFGEASGQRLNYRIGPRRAGDITAVYADVSKIQSQLGWSARRSLREALEDAWRWEEHLKQ
ncbi:MAG: UDP-glucose 4-epimerase GalE [Saprospirales bacterium]|nr:UDP-glucose 4-epimerase GalE [Saprospirales bacterium]